MIKKEIVFLTIVKLELLKWIKRYRIKWWKKKNPKVFLTQAVQIRIKLNYLSKNTNSKILSPISGILQTHQIKTHQH